MQLHSLAAYLLAFSFPLTAIAQQRCIVSGMSLTNANKEFSVPVNFDAATKKYTASVPPGSVDLTIPNLSIMNSGGVNRVFCLAVDPSSSAVVNCFDVPPKSTCAIPDFQGAPTRLDTYKRQ
ncbi:hypothetical protein CCHR01_08703 [Colletotrichum chrysophilum]|uniref:Uncharacterized protein n=1 Tax=Colletotrichum chrysophilum TaxID=1836956 RepID=A0AAD9EHH1_9PEZI|nr:hypothetical protein CCHR01_08703 [Colletotrichum chrysophilum]